jgi:outer membrane protein OmpA-like peptidoglycan-associated protein
MMKRLFLLTMAFALIGIFPALSQGNAQDKLFRADKYFSIRNYKEALPLFLEVIEAGNKDPMVHYKTGVCYFNEREINDQVKSIPYLQFAVDNGGDKLPPKAWFELGEAYHKDEQIDRALVVYEKYKALSKSDRVALAQAERALEIANNAKFLMADSKEVQIINLGPIINSEFTEYNPVVSADETVMAYTALRPNTGKSRPGDKFIEEIYVTYRESGNWSEPQPLKIESNFNVGTAGLSADGRKMLIFIGAPNNTGNLYTIDRVGDKWSNPVSLGAAVNSRFLESTGSFTPDGKVLYFASNRIDGFGGLDLYKIEKNAKGEWGRPENLGPEINTKYDEDAPFIHPDQITLFFTSNGHNTMGGRDIFRSVMKDGKWTKPENMGYPINTTANDNYFTLSADGKTAYFSSDRKGGYGAQDIYTLDMPFYETNIPLTMVKGQILDSETGKSIPTKIYMVDNESGKKIDFVYSPDPITGNYLIILPPAKNYDMVIESEGYLPYTLNVNVPNQTYFYELYQRIYLKTIKHFDVVVGQEVVVKNAFYDTQKDRKTELRKAHESHLIKSGNIDVYQLMDDLMGAKDEAAIKYILDLLHMENPIEDVNFNEKENKNIEAAVRVYYYDESDEDKFEQKKVGNDIIFSLPTMYVTEEAEKQRDTQRRPTSYDPKLLSQKAVVYFDVDKSELKAQYKPELDKLMAILKKHPELGVEISGFASRDGNEEYNRKLSNDRAISVLDYINQRGGIVRRRIIAKGYGATQIVSGSKEESRRVEIKIVDLELIREKVE